MKASLGLWVISSFISKPVAITVALTISFIDRVIGSPEDDVSVRVGHAVEEREALET